MGRILIVEDELSLAEGMSVILSDAGHQIVGIADDETSALQMANFGTPDLVLMDIQLANDDDGVEVARRVVEAQDRVSIIFVSAHLDYRTRKRAGAIAGARFLVKPYSPQQLLEAVTSGLDSTIRAEPQKRAKPPLERGDAEAAEIRHRLSNCYQVLANLIELRLNRTSDGKSRKHLIWVRET